MLAGRLAAGGNGSGPRTMCKMTVDDSILARIVADWPTMPEGERAAFLSEWAKRRPQAASQQPPAQLPTWADLRASIGPITWSWDGWLPNGLLTIVAAEPSMGKSNLCLHIAATFCDARYSAWPDGSPAGDIQRGRVVWAEAEQGQAIHLQRAAEWGLDDSAFIIPSFGAADDDFKLDDDDKWQALTHAAWQDDVRLIVIDSLSGASTRNENDANVIGTVGKLAGLARDVNKPILLTHHLRKRGLLDADGPSLDRLRGSSAIVQPARVVWVIDTPDLTDKEARRLSQVKNNLTRAPQPVGMTIGERGITFGAAPEAPRPISQQEAAINFLLALLSDEALPAEEVLEQARLAGHSDKTVRRAKDKIGVVSMKRGGGGGPWLWGLPAKH